MCIRDSSNNVEINLLTVSTNGLVCPDTKKTLVDIQQIFDDAPLHSRHEARCVVGHAIATASAELFDQWVKHMCAKSAKNTHLQGEVSGEDE